jgi:branched-chain amino acid transport system ATP-binding protein
MATHAGADPRATVRAGLAHVIEGHRIFTQLSITDNLFLAAYDLPRRERSARVEEALSLFPEIAAKRHDRGGALSGGQKQMLAVAQGLVRRPRLLMLDEPSAGLSPCSSTACSVAARLRETGAGVLLVEQLVEKTLRLPIESCLGGRTRARRLGIGTRLAASARARLFWSRVLTA